MQIKIEGDVVSMSKADFMELVGKPQGTDISALFSQESKGESTEVIITNYLLSRGIQRHLSGFDYLRDAIRICLEDKTQVHRVIELYGKVAETHNSTASRVERAIRHAIVRNFPSGDNPVNSQFIADATDDVRLMLQNKNN